MTDYLTVIAQRENSGGSPDAHTPFNIGFPEYEGAREDIERAARLASLDALIAKLPDGFDTIVGERGLKRSGGENNVSRSRAPL
jgi:ABC-type transport system involved in Fe-S cluster assembly fused permease/ATPase subunit